MLVAIEITIIIVILIIIVHETKKKKKDYYSVFNTTEFLNHAGFSNLKNVDIRRVTNFGTFNPEKKVVLITEKLDDSPSILKNWREIADHPNLIAWYAVHNDINHPKVKHLPLGLNYYSFYVCPFCPVERHMQELGTREHPLEQERKLKEIISILPPLKDRPLRAYTTASHRNTSNIRKDKFKYSRKNMVEELKNKNYIDFQEGLILREESWKKHGEYSFILSPIGIGLDCHRTWEALLLGCIPILQSSPLDPLFNDLPVVIVDNWNEVNEENMAKWKEYILSRNWNYNKLFLKYWVDKIKDEFK